MQTVRALFSYNKSFPTLMHIHTHTPTVSRNDNYGAVTLNILSSERYIVHENSNYSICVILNHIYQIQWSYESLVYNSVQTKRDTYLDKTDSGTLKSWLYGRKQEKRRKKKLFKKIRIEFK